MAAAVGTLLALALAQTGPTSQPDPMKAQIDWAVAVFPSGDEFSLEVAADDRSRALGYMFREEVGPREGMLFVFAKSEIHSFWMKNCRVPLDLIWLDASFTVVEIASEQQPCPPEGECPSILPMRSSRYVLEVAGGMAEQQGLRVGERIIVHSDPPLAP
jgi:uncharacterized membrane protein (UPF0127 family)